KDGQEHIPVTHEGRAKADFDGHLGSVLAGGGPVKKCRISLAASFNETLNSLERLVISSQLLNRPGTKLITGKAEHGDPASIHVDDPAGLWIKEDNALCGGVEDVTITEFLCQCVPHSFSIRSNQAPRCQSDAKLHTSDDHDGHDGCARTELGLKKTKVFS